MNKDLMKNTFATVDIIIEHPEGIVIIERKNKPMGLALVGGFVDAGEKLWEAAVRESKEEVSLDVEITDILHTYSGPKRDGRLSAASTCFIAKAEGTPEADDDAKGVMVLNEKEIRLLQKKGAFVFDHSDMLDDYFHFKSTGEKPGAKR